MSDAPRRFPLLVFDWDGTLIDSISSIVACTQAMLEELGLTPVPEERIKAGIGLGLREAVENLAPGYDEALFVRICDVYRELWFGHYALRPVLFDGVRRMLAGLGEAGHVMTVATAKSRKGLKQDFQRTGIGDLFDASRTADEAPPGKPEPRMLLELLEETGFRAGAALVIGDSVHDMEMAANAGVAAVGVATGSQSCDQLLASGAEICLPRVTDLPKWLRRRS